MYTIDMEASFMADDWSESTVTSTKYCKIIQYCFLKKSQIVKFLMNLWHPLFRKEEFLGSYLCKLFFLFWHKTYILEFLTCIFETPCMHLSLQMSQSKRQWRWNRGGSRGICPSNNFLEGRRQTYLFVLLLLYLAW